MMMSHIEDCTAADADAVRLSDFAALLDRFEGRNLANDCSQAFLGISTIMPVIAVLVKSTSHAKPVEIELSLFVLMLSLLLFLLIKTSKNTRRYQSRLNKNTL
jgi:hypothetical protein